MIYIQPEKLLATGQLEIVLSDANGCVKDHRNVKNTVTISGKNYIANRMKSTLGGHTIAGEMSHMAIGTGTSGSNDNIQTESTAAGHRIALATAGGTVSGNAVTYSATFPGNVIATNVAVTEAGIFNYGTYAASPSALQFMLCRTTFLVVNKLIADTLTINWTVTIN